MKTARELLWVVTFLFHTKPQMWAIIKVVGMEGGRRTERRERQFLPKGFVQLSPGLVILEGRGSCRLIFSHP